jgi:zinc transport system substrate-binding protein
MRFFILPFLFLSTFLFSQESPHKPTLLVSVPPYRYFVKEIAGDTVDVKLMVPVGASAHTYEPTPKQMIQSSDADIWFRLGEPFETKAIAALLQVNPSMQVVDLRSGVSLLHGSCKHHHIHSSGSCGSDLHLWLSPKIAKIQAGIIAEALKSRYPEHANDYEAHLTQLLNALDELDRHIQSALSAVKNRSLLVSHPAYAYFCQDYNFRQISIEFEGKDPTAKQLTTLLREAKNSSVRAIFTQPQYSDKAAQLIGKQIGAKIIELDPYAEDYFATMKLIAKLVAEYS